MTPIALPTTCFLTGLACLLGAVPAFAADRWQEAGSGAVAILPVPKPATAISGGSLYCAEQRWAFLLRTTSEAALSPGSGKAKITLGSDVFETDAEIAPDSIRLAVPSNILVPLKEATSLAVAIGSGKSALRTAISLRSSKLVIEAVAPRCSQIDMSAFEAVSPSETDAAVAAASGLLADEIKLFRAFTTKEPVVSTATLDIAGNRRLMFAALCGSVSYFGDSGCSLTAYAADGAESIWRMVYETEGVHMYIDPNHANSGWPNVVTLPYVGGTEPNHWQWTGSGYALLGLATAEQDKAQEEGDSAQ